MPRTSSSHVDGDSRCPHVSFPLVSHRCQTAPGAPKQPTPTCTTMLPALRQPAWTSHRSPARLRYALGDGHERRQRRQRFASVRSEKRNRTRRYESHTVLTVPPLEQSVRTFCGVRLEERMSAPDPRLSARPAWLEEWNDEDDDLFFTGWRNIKPALPLDPHTQVMQTRSTRSFCPEGLPRILL